jgi:hypothetical protein
MTRHQSEVPSTARSLLRVGAYRGAALILFNAQIAEVAHRDAALSTRTPDGPLPLRRRPEKQLNATNHKHA